MSKEEIGTLIVVLLKARNLNDKHKFRKQDAFAKATLNGKEQKTKVEPKGGQHPVWDEEFRWPVYQSTDKKSRTLEISCYSKEPREDDLLGTGTIDISETLRTGEFDDWIPLSMDNVVRGDVYLEMTYYANGPPPPSATPPVAVTPPAQAAMAESISRPPTSRPVQIQRPSSSLAVPQPYYNGGGNLMRRPSKLSPQDRLSRPSGSPPSSYSDARPYPNTPLSPVHDEYHRRQSNPQPPPANLVPNFLRPGAVSSGIRPVSDPIASANPYLTGAASTARPGTAQPGYQRPVGGTPAPAPVATPPANPSNPYLTGGATSAPTPAPSIQYSGAPHPPQQQQPAPPQQPQQPTQPYQQEQQYPQQPQYPPQQQYQQPPQQQYQQPPQQQPPPAGVPSFWSTSHPADAPAGGFSFPVPSLSGGPPAPSNGQSPAVTPPIPGAYPAIPNLGPTTHPLRYGHHRHDSDPRDDPALRTRYQTPLPLPPGAPRSAPQSPPVPRSPPLPPVPSYTSYAPPPLPPVPQSAPRSPPRSPRNDGDRQRIAQHKWAEDEAARRREQEIKDMELAMQLDREINGL